MTKEPESFDELIDAIAEGSPIDWARVEASGRIDPSDLRGARALAGLRASTDPLAPGAAEEADVAGFARGFERIEEIGHGAFGRVWRAQDVALRREVALKVLEDDGRLTPEQRTRFLREARLLAACEHENVLRIHSVEERDGRLELCLEYIDGVTLEKMVRDGGPLSATEAARIGVDLCRALAAIHAKGLLHRDVKPANVMRARNGRIVLLDFGLAHASDLEARRGPNAGGTPRLMAPELIEGGQELDGRVDLYALGVTLYWLVTREWPYEAETRDEMFDKLLHQPPIPLLDRRADLPSAFIAIIERALERDPARRFRSAGEMESALRAFLSWRADGSSAGATEGGRARGRWRALAVVGAVLLVAASAYAAWALRPLRATIEVGRPFEGARGAIRIEVPTAASPLHLGDAVVARLTLNRPAFVYGFDVDADDRYYAVYPMPGASEATALAAGTHELPGRDENGAAICWTINQSSALETYVFFVSRERSDDLQALWDACPKTVAEGQAPSGQDLRKRLENVAVSRGAAERGGGTTTPLRRVLAADSKRRLVDDLLDLADQPDAIGGVRVLVAKLPGAAH